MKVPHEDYYTAMQAIANMLKTGRHIFPKYWDTLDFDSRQQAIMDSKCARCRKIKKLTGTIQDMFGTYGACNECNDQTNYPKLSKKDYEDAIIAQFEVEGK